MQTPDQDLNNASAVISASGEMAEFVKQHDWGLTAAGPVDNWPDSLCVTINTVLNSPFPMVLYWGRDLIVFYNDALRAILGSGGKHPHILGKKASEAWSEIWSSIEPAFQQVLAGGKAAVLHDQLLPVFRHGRIEQVYWTVTLSPVQSRSGIVEGVLASSAETTNRLTRLFSVVENSSSPIAIFKGPDFIIEEANTASLDLWNAPAEAIGRPLLELFPQVKDHPFVKILREVSATGESSHGYEIPSSFGSGDKSAEKYFNFEYRPYRDKGGATGAVMVLGTDVTEQVRVKRQLAIAQEDMNASIVAAELGYWNLDPMRNTLKCNAKTRELFGLPEEEDIDLNLALKAIHELDRDMVTAKMTETLLGRNNGTYDIQYRVSTGKRDYRYVRTVGKAYFDNAGLAYRLSGTVRDITLEREKQDAVNYEKRLYETVLENTSLALFLMDEKQHCVYINEAAEIMTGFGLDELKGKQLHYYIHHKHPDGSHYPLEDCPIDQALPTKMRMEGQEVFVHKDGSFYDVSFIASPIVLNGVSVGTVIEVQDITGKKKKEQELIESELRFRSIADNAPAFIFMGNQDTEVEYVNKTWEDFTGLTGEEAKGKAWATVTHPDDIEDNFRMYNDAFEKRSTYQFETRQRSSRDGLYHWILWKGVPRFLAGGEFLGILGIGFDITERKNAEAALVVSEEKYRTLFERMEQAFCIIEVIFDHTDRPIDYRFLEINPVFSKQTGLTNARGKTARELIPGLEEKWFQMYGDVARSGKSVRFIEGSDAMQRWFEVYAFPVKEANRGKVAILFSDISERKKSEDILKKSEENLRLISDFMPQIAWSTDEKGYHDFYNQRWYEFTGLSFDETRGDGWANVLHPEDHARATAVWNHCLETGDLYEIEYRMRRADGEYRWLLGRAMPLRDDTGKTIRWFGTCTDIHDQKTFTDKLEILVNERTKALNRSNEDLQQFAHVASHDLKEPVRKIRTFTSALKDEMGERLTERELLYIEKVEKASERMFQMIEGVLKYSSLQSIQEPDKEVELASVFRSILSDLDLVISNKNAIIEIAPLPSVKGVDVLLYQLFYNLMNNALKFSKPGVRPLIRISTVSPGEELPDGHGTGEKYVVIKMQDNGIGFEPTHAEKIFITFSRLHSKDKFEGTGLGLALCKKIVERHKGKIWAAGIPGEGATFSVMLRLVTPS